MKPRHLIFAAMLVVFAVCLFRAEARTYNLTVLADHHTQAWNRFYEMGVATDHQNTLIHTYWGRGIGNALKVGHNEAGFKYWRGHAVLDADVGLVTAATTTTLTLNWTRFDSVYNIGIAAGMRPVVEISCTPPVLASSTTTNDQVSAWYNGVVPNKSAPTKYGWGQWVALMDSIVVHCENKWGSSEVRNNWYFEVWNEPDWWYAGFPGPYLTLFDYTVQGLKQGDPQVRVGGPACEGTNIFQGGADLSSLLNHCHTGTNAATGKVGTQIDFLTYHWYADNAIPSIGINGNVLNANNPATIQKMVIDSMKHYSWFTGPVFEDETGPTFDAYVVRDMQQSASWLAKTVHLLNEGGPNYPPPPMFAYWAISDLYEEQETNVSNLSFQEGNYGMLCRGDSSYANSWDIEKPVFQAYRLLHKLGANEDSSNGGVSATDGVNLVATSSVNNDSIQILVYDHYASQTQTSAPTDSIILTVNNIPWAGSAHVEDFLVDTTHSNTHTTWVGQGKPAAPSHTQWDAIRLSSNLAHYDSVATVTLTGNTFTKTFPLHYYSVMLITLTNPNGVSVKRSSERMIDNYIPASFRTEISNGKMMLTLPGSGQFTVRLVTPNGRTLISEKSGGHKFHFTGQNSRRNLFA